MNSQPDPTLRGSTAGPHVLVVGSTMMDLVTYVERMPGAGETLAGGPFELGFGGKGANQAVVAKLLGARVSFVNRVGDDLFGEQTRAHLDSLGIDVEHVTPAPHTATGAATILVEPSGENRIVIAAGANGVLSVEDVEAAFEGGDVPDLVLCQLEVDQAAVLRAFELGREAGAITVLNPAPASVLHPRLPELTDWLLPNETELKLLARSVGVVSDDLAFMGQALARSWSLNVVTTLGERGARLQRASGPRVAAVTPTPSVAVADTVGAGDAFAAAFSVALAAGSPPEIAVDVGCRCAADSVTRRGTQRSYLSSERFGELRDEILVTR